MKHSKKYTCRLSQNNNQNDALWTAEIVRKITTKKSTVTKSQHGFASEAEAQAWGDAEVTQLLKKTNTKELNKRRGKAK